MDERGKLAVSSASLIFFSTANVLGRREYVTLKSYVLVSLLILALVVLVLAYSQSSGWSLTVQTDRPYYTLGDKVYISGILTYNGYPYQGALVSVTVSLPGGSGFYLSETTNTAGGYSVNFTLGTSSAELGQGGVTVSASPTGASVTASTSFLVIDRIYILANGNVSPSSAPVSRSGSTYRLLGNITGYLVDGIEVQLGNVFLDGAGFTVSTRNPSSSYGVYLAGVSNVTVWNVSVQSFQEGVFELGCSNCTVAESSLSNDGCGVYLQQSSLNAVEENNITKNTSAGVFLEMSDSNSVFHNNFFNNTCQASCSGSSGNSWDDGYPSGGNYWSDYLSRYSNASEVDGSGIWNTPYVIDSADADNYPLVNPWDSDSLPAGTMGTVHLLLTEEPAETAYAEGQSVTLDVDVLNEPSQPLNSTLTLTVTGPSGYYYFDFQTVNVTANDVKDYSFAWIVPGVAGTYVVEVSLVPPQLTAYDAAWLQVT